MQKFASEMRSVFHDALNAVIVYGSYARGDYNELSDVDVMILVTLDENEIKKMTNSICDISFDYFMKYGIEISPIVKNVEHFEYWSDTLPFYRNVKDEGVRLNA